MKNTPLILLITFPAVAGMAAALAPVRNPSFEFCTTKAYGYPMPWRVDNCLCDGKDGRTEFPVVHAGVNLATIGVAAGLLAAMVLRLRRTP